MQTTNSSDLLTEEPYLERADTGKRFLNYVIDVVIFYIFAILVGVVVVVVNQPTLEELENASGASSTSYSLVSNLTTLFLYAVYMGTMEAIFKGKSIGKFITKTRAVNFDGSPISARTAFLRGFSRAVPFCAFSAFGTPCNPWQDSWTNSMVINEKTSTI